MNEGCQHVWIGTNKKYFSLPPLYEIKCLKCGEISSTPIFMHSEKIIEQEELTRKEMEKELEKSRIQDIIDSFKNKP